MSKYLQDRNTNIIRALAVSAHWRKNIPERIKDYRDDKI